MEAEPKPLQFRGGDYVSVLPLAVFLFLTILLVVFGAPKVEGMIVASMVAISAGMLVARNLGAYSERVFSVMANRTATVAVVCWLWAGAFSGILADSGLVEAIVLVGFKLDLQGGAFTLAVFVSAALFAVSVGTGLGTIIGFTAVIYPAGLVLGAHPGALMGAIFSGAALGDNLAPVSDTTIVSAATQETDVGGVVRSRLKYVLIAAGIASVLFLLFGGGGEQSESQALGSFLETVRPSRLLMLVPAVLVFIVAVSGGHFLVALTVGIATACIIGPAIGAFPLARVFTVTHEGEVAGSLVSGATSLLPTCILTLLLVTIIELMRAGGFFDRLIAFLDRAVARTARGTELAIMGLISFANLCVSVNTVAMITAGPFANTLRKRHGLHPYRSANLLDTVSCSFPYFLPYAATVVTALSVQEQVAERYDFIQVVTWSQLLPYCFYGLVLFPLMIVAVITGFGRREG